MVAEEMIDVVAESGPSGGLTVRPARLYLVDPDLAPEVAAPAYDMLPAAERETVARENPHSFLNAITSPPPGASHDEQDRVLRQNASVLDNMLAQRVFRPWPRPALALYRLATGDHVQTGIVAAVAVKDYEAGRVRPHELTRSDREALLARYLETVGAGSSPVALAYRSRPGLTAVSERVARREPAIHFTAADGLDQTVWMIDDPSLVETVAAEFAATGHLYVTDGHHRLAAAARFAKSRRARGAATSAETGSSGEPWEYFLAVLFPDAELQVDSFNRCVTPPAGMPSSRILDALRRRARVRGVVRPPEPGLHEFAMFLDERWYRVAPDVPNSGGSVDTLDAALLQDLVLRPVFGIDDPRSDPRIDHLAGTRDVAALEARCRASGEVAFLLHPPGMDSLMAVSDAGQVMPPKSTWFHPKARSGVFLRFVR